MIFEFGKKLRDGLAAVLILIPVMVGCNQTSNPSSGTPASSETVSSQPVQPPPPQQPRLTLYMVPLNQAEFSMEAIQGNKKRILEEPENLEALVKLADANFMIQRFEVSKDYYERALKVDENLADVRISLSNSLIFMQKPDEAIAELDKLLSIQKDHPEALFNKGLILLQSKGDTAGAEQTWKRLIAVHPDHTLARQIQAELERA